MILAALLVSLTLQDAQWKFDGDVQSRHPTKANGRLDFIDSPIAGKMAVFNGVDAFVQADPAATLGAGAADFSVSAWIYGLDRRGGPLFARKSWTLTILPDGTIKFASDAGTMATPVGLAPAAQWLHLVVSVKRDGESKMYINGDAAATGTIKAGDLDPAQAPLLIGKSEDGKFFTGLMDDLRIYPKALDAAEAAKLTDEGLPWLRAKAHAKTPFPGKFELQPNDVIAFVGGENMRVGLDLGYLETLLSLHAAGKSVRYRNMAWEGDTVYEQPRPLNFGPWADQFRRTGTSIVFVQFGQVECLEGKAGLERFTAAYEALIAQFAATTKRIVLVSPTPFGKGPARQPDLLARNDDLKLYVDAIRALAAKNGVLFIDLASKALAEEGLTRNGLHLNAAGQWIAAKETARQLEIPGVSDLDTPDARGVFPREAYETIRTAIRSKNALWQEGWRPTNWAFLAGDRMEQPSSRDHQDRRIRWFPVEIQQFPALIRRDEAKIDALVEKK
jgi:hypothetical protein